MRDFWGRLPLMVDANSVGRQSGHRAKAFGLQYLLAGGTRHPEDFKGHRRVLAEEDTCQWRKSTYHL